MNNIRMTDLEAIKILELPNTFTGREALAAYHKLVQKNHPDISKEDESTSHERMIKINEAHDYLKNKYFSNPADLDRRVTINSYEENRSSSTDYKTNNKDTVLDEYKNTVLQNIAKYKAGVDQYPFPDYIQSITAKILLDFISIIMQIKFAPDIPSVDNSLKEFKEKLLNHYQDMFFKFINKNNIPNDYYDDLYFDCTIIEFYEQLEQIKRNYQSNINKKDEYIKKLQEEIDKYKYYYGYDKLKDKIKLIYDNTLKKLEKDYYRNYFSYLLEMKNDILKCVGQNLLSEFEDIAHKYISYSGYNKFIEKEIEYVVNDAYYSAQIDLFENSAVEQIKDVFEVAVESIFKDSLKISNKIKELKQIFIDHSSLLDDTDFKTLYDRLLRYEDNFNKKGISSDFNKLEEDINKLLDDYRKKNSLSENPVFMKSYTELLKRYHNRLNEINPISDYMELNNINKIYSGVNDLINELIKDEISLDDVILIFDRITFRDYNYDTSLLNFSLKSASGVYLKLNSPATILLYLYRDNKMLKNGILAEEYHKDSFVPIEDVLKDAEFIGKNVYTGTQYIYILYEVDNFIFYLDRSQDIVRVATKIKLEKYSPTNLIDYSDIGEKYQDKDFLIESIKKDLENKYQRNNKKGKVF